MTNERVSDERLAEIVATANYAGDDADLWLSSAEGRALAAELQSLRSAREAEPVQRNIGMIAHIDHGKTSLTAAITRILADAHPSPSTEGLGVRADVGALLDEFSSDVESLAMLQHMAGSAPSREQVDQAKADIENTRRRILSALSTLAEQVERKYKLGDRVTKLKGSSWTGRVVGFYSTTLTPIGYAVESEREPGSVQIYPQAALELVP